MDTGIGIPADELPRLFRPFAQVDTGLTRRHGGTGLGLYISRRLATMLGGHIEVEQRAGRRVDVQRRAAAGAWRSAQPRRLARGCAAAALADRAASLLDYALQQAN